jgi:hypothetical protein
MEGEENTGETRCREHKPGTLKSVSLSFQPVVCGGKTMPRIVEEL